MSSPDDNSPETEPKKVENAEESEKSENIEIVELPSTETDANTEIRYFQTKKIRFGPLEYQIVTQNANGPCPLIAIINALVLKGKVVIAPGELASSTELLTLLTNFILALTPPEKTEEKQIFEANLEGVMNLMETLINGLDVNVRFSDVDAFEFTAALSLFDMVTLPLYHVWLPDPQFPEMLKLIDNLNYNELVLKLCSEEETTEKALIQSFHDETKAQITFHGLATLMGRMKDGELAVLFQNNHFSTIFKRRDEIFKLVSDEGYAKVTNIVWETFSSVDGDCIFVNCDFGNFKPIPPPTVAATSPSSSTVVRTTELQDDVEMGEEVLERPASAPLKRPEVVTPPTSYPATARGTDHSTVTRGHATVTPRQSQERKNEKNTCSVM